MQIGQQRMSPAGAKTVVLMSLPNTEVNECIRPLIKKHSGIVLMKPTKCCCPYFFPWVPLSLGLGGSLFTSVAHNPLLNRAICLLNSVLELQSSHRAQFCLLAARKQSQLLLNVRKTRVQVETPPIFQKPKISGKQFLQSVHSSVSTFWLFQTQKILRNQSSLDRVREMKMDDDQLGINED